jgi:hypothetical protein
MNNLARLEEISQELHDIANSYAGEETGTEATLLHLASGNIQRVINSLNGERIINTREVLDFRLLLNLA